MRSVEAHCKGCHTHFTSPRAADRHQIDDRCCDPAELQSESGEPRFVSKETTFGETWLLNEQPPPSSCATNADGSGGDDPHTVPVLGLATPGLRSPSRREPTAA